MSKLIRSAKSGADWTINELKAYNITVVRQDAATFFETPDLPEPTVSSEILTALDPNDATDDNVYELLRTMDLAMSIAPAEESAVNDFVVLLLRALGYTRRGRVLRTRKDIRFVVCGENKHTQTDVCIVDDTDILVLLVQEDKLHLENSDPEAQLIAEAIAAFAANNQTRQQTLGQAALPSKIIPGITMKGTSPIFRRCRPLYTLTFPLFRDLIAVGAKA